VAGTPQKPPNLAELFAESPVNSATPSDRVWIRFERSSSPSAGWRLVLISPEVPICKESRMNVHIGQIAGAHIATGNSRIAFQESWQDSMSPPAARLGDSPRQRPLSAATRWDALLPKSSRVDVGGSPGPCRPL